MPPSSANAHAAPPQIIEGEFRVLATRDPAAPRPSPNRRRLAARVLFWNAAGVFVIVALPRLF